jgi:hypothetical protein
MKCTCSLALTGLALGFGWCGPAAATDGVGALYNYEVLLDTDNNTATGGPVSVVQGAEAPHNELGIDYIVRAGAGIPGLPDSFGANTTGPDVLYRDVLKWNANTGSFELMDHDTSMYPLGTNLAGNGLVEFGAALSLIGNPPVPIRGVFHAFNVFAFDNDYTRSFLIGGLPAPTHSTGGLVLLVALLLASGIILLNKQRLGARAMALVAAVLLAASIAWAGNIVLNGDFSDWAGIGPVVTDPAGDSSIADPAEDILAGYAVIQRPNIFFRLDLVSLFNVEG